MFQKTRKNTLKKMIKGKIRVIDSSSPEMLGIEQAAKDAVVGDIYIRESEVVGFLVYMVDDDPIIEVETSTGATHPLMYEQQVYDKLLNIIDG